MHFLLTVQNSINISLSHSFLYLLQKYKIDTKIEGNIFILNLQNLDIESKRSRILHIFKCNSNKFKNFICNNNSNRLLVIYHNNSKESPTLR